MEERPETLLWPRESDGRDLVCMRYEGVSLVSPRGRLKGWWLSSAWGVMMLRRRLCSEPMEVSGGGSESSWMGGVEVDGLNSMASGLNEKARGEDRGDRRNCEAAAAVDGASVDARVRGRD